MSKAKQENAPVFSPIGRVAFPALGEKNSYTDKFEVTLVFEEGTDLTSLKVPAAQQAKELKKKVGDKVKLRSPFRDGSEREHLDGFVEGQTFVAFRSAQKPVLVGPNMEELLPDDIYAGCYARVKCSCYHYNNEGRGVSFGLAAVQKARDGERVGFKPSADGFDSIPEDEQGGDIDTAAELDAIFGDE